MLSELPSAGLLEGFMSRGKSYLSLTYDPSQKYEPTHFTVAATVTESFLVKLVNPSDVTSKIPPSVRKTLNHLFKSNSKILDFNDEDYDNGEGPVAKPDIDKLYETIKVYHESMGHTGTGGIDLVCDPQVKCQHIRVPRAPSLHTLQQGSKTCGSRLSQKWKNVRFFY